MRTPVLSLGESGLDEPGALVFRLYIERDPPEELDVSGVVAHAIASSGEYWFDGIDLDSGERGTLVIARTSEPLLSLNTVRLSATVPTVVVYREDAD